MTRLLYYTKDRYPPFRVDLIELFSRHLAGAGLIKSGLAVEWLMLRDRPGLTEVVRHSADESFLVMGPGRHWANAMMFARTLFHVARGYYDIVQVRDHPISAFLFLLTARVAARPFVYWMSFPILEVPADRAQDPNETFPLWRRVLMRVYSRLGAFLYYGPVLRWADHIFVQSEQMKAELVLRGIDAQKLTPVAMGVSIEEYDRHAIVPAKDQRLDGRKVLVYSGTTLPRRRIDIQVRALARLVRAGYDAVLVVCGEQRPKDMQRLNAVATEEGIPERLIFTGHLPLNEALAYVRRADVCLSPYPTDFFHRSGTPTKLVEYLAMGRPVVGNDHPDQGHVLSSSGAGVIVPLTPEGFANGVGRLLADPAVAERMAALGPEWVRRNRSYTLIAPLVANIYNRLLQP